jgi:hypothetical protein
MDGRMMSDSGGQDPDYRETPAPQKKNKIKIKQYGYPRQACKVGRV